MSGTVTTWRAFREQSANSTKLLERLNDFSESVLVAGCQRSGTTMLARIITRSMGMTNYWFGLDDELDAAMILAGMVEHEPRGRYCFQTTYVDERYREYFEHQGRFKLVWMLRNPFSTVYSLLHNWPKPTFDRTFIRAAAPTLGGWDRHLFQLGRTRLLSRLRQACYIYNAKVTQVPVLMGELGEDHMMVVDYDDLVLNAAQVLPAIYRFIDLEYRSEYANGICVTSVGKQRHLDPRDRRAIKRLCEPVYISSKTYSCSSASYSSASQVSSRS